MKEINKNKTKEHLKKQLGREATASEILNMENDALLLTRFLIDKVEELEDRIIKLEK